MEDTGIIVKLHKNNLAEVKITASGACDSCHESGSCGMEGLAGKDVTIYAINEIDAVVGDCICLETQTSKEVTASIIGFGLPTASLIIGVFLGYKISEGWAILGGFLGLLLAVLVLKIISLISAKKRGKLYPIIISKVN
jgi:positive regulator of sigma E activity